MEGKINGLEEIKNEDVKKLIRDVLENPEKFEIENKYLLPLTLLTRNSGDFPHWKRMRIVQGEPEIITMDIYDEYDTEYKEVLVIPKQIGTIIRVSEYESLSEEETREVEEYYIFTRNGWAVIRAK